jgi:serine/threonine protein kinase
LSAVVKGIAGNEYFVKFCSHNSMKEEYEMNCNNNDLFVNAFGYKEIQINGIPCYCMIMEKGTVLSEYAEAIKDDSEAKFKLCEELLLLLGRLYDKNICHLDIKEPNILCFLDNERKLKYLRFIDGSNLFSREINGNYEIKFSFQGTSGYRDENNYKKILNLVKEFNKNKTRTKDQCGKYMSDIMKLSQNYDTYSMGVVLYSLFSEEKDSGYSFEISKIGDINSKTIKKVITLMTSCNNDQKTVLKDAVKLIKKKIKNLA